MAIEQSNLSRRSFITIPGAGAVLASAPAILPAKSTSNTLRVGMIGFGTRGRYLLSLALKSPDVHVVALCDNHDETLARADSLVKQAGQTAETFLDYRKMLDQAKDLDAVIIATPTYVHKDMAIAVMERGHHLYCEKPMGLNPEECRQVVNAAKRSPGIYQAGFQCRHDPKYRAAVDFIHRNGVGKPLFLQGFRHSQDLPHGRRSDLWYFTAALSGDNIVEQSCHMFDAFTWAIGKRPLRAYGNGGLDLYKDNPPGRTTMDNYCVIYEYPGDLRMVFSQVYFDPQKFSGIGERVFGSFGAIELSTATWWELGKTNGAVTLDVPDANKNMNEEAIAAFFDCIRTKKTPVNNAETARISNLVAMLGRKAIYERRVVTWEEVDI